MIKVKALPVILRVVSKLEIKTIIPKLKGLDLKSVESGALSPEDLGILGAEILAEIIPQLGKFEEDIVELIAAVKDISLEEAGELDAIEAISDIFSDKSFVSFFKSSLMKKAGQ